MGLIAPEETATILSNVLNYILVEEDQSDPFFTPEQWEKYKKLEKQFLINLLKKDIVLQVKKVPNVFVLKVSKVQRRN